MVTRIKATRLFSDDLLQHYRQQGDTPADTVIAALVEAEGPAKLRSLMSWLADTSDFSVAQQHPVIQDFFRQYATLPAWADPDRMKRGMAFFKKHARHIGLTLGFYSLPYSYLGAYGAQVLWFTERIKNDTTRRLQETGEWVFAVNNPKEWQSPPRPQKGSLLAQELLSQEPAIQRNTTDVPSLLTQKLLSQEAPLLGAGGALRTLKIRLIHAGARWFSLHSGRWNMAWGYPVNQEDMAGTNLAFSYIVLLGLRKSGITASEQEEEDYLHHINVVNYVNGVSDELLPKNLREAYTLNHAIARRQFATSEAGVGLTRALLDAIASGIADRQRSQTNSGQSGLSRSGMDRPEILRNLAAGEMRFFLGDQYADWLGIPNVPFEKRLAGLLSRLPIFPSQLAGL